MRPFSISARDIPRFGAYVDTEKEILHRKLRRVYFDRTQIDFNNIPELFVTTRQPENTLRNLWQNKKVAGIIRAREEFPEVNVVHKLRDIYDVYKETVKHSGTSQPYNLSIDDDTDYFRVSIEDVVLHEFYDTWPMFMIWNRFIPGRPNRMKMRVVIENWEDSEAKYRGGRIELREDHVLVDVYTEEHPRVLKADFKDMLPGKTYTVASLVRDLPDGIKLAPVYEKRMFEPLFIVQKTLKSHIYWEILKHRLDVTKFVDLDLGLMGHQPKTVEKKLDGTLTEGVFFSKTEEEKIKKLSVMLGKDYEEIKADFIKSRLQKAQTEASKVKKVIKK